nr:gluconokinase [uncultured Cohaesibacter sp.]
MSTAVSQFRFDGATLVIVMGVSGCGKSTIGAGLAKLQGVPYLDADDFHPEANVDKMSKGIPLTDEDRWPWLQRLGDIIKDYANKNGGVVIACSALRRIYRQKLSQAAGLPVLFAHLDGDRDLLFSRMKARKDHYMPASLLESQIQTLEKPGSDEPAVSLSIDQSIAEIIGQLNQIVDEKKQDPMPIKQQAMASKR